MNKIIQLSCPRIIHRETEVDSCITGESDDPCEGKVEVTLEYEPGDNNYGADTEWKCDQCGEMGRINANKARECFNPACINFPYMTMQNRSKFEAVRQRNIAASLPPTEKEDMRDIHLLRQLSSVGEQKVWCGAAVAFRVTMKIENTTCVSCRHEAAEWGGTLDDTIHDRMNFAEDDLNARIASLESTVAALTKERAIEDTLAALRTENESLRSQLSEARKDSDRLDWVEGDDRQIVRVWVYPGEGLERVKQWRVGNSPKLRDCYAASTLREAIDAASLTPGSPND